LEPNDTPPDAPSGRTITIHLTRDTLVLIAALLFLGVAILLAVVFPSKSPNTTTPTSIGAAQTSTAEAVAIGAISPTALGSGVSTPIETNTPAGSPATVVPTIGSYPAPTSSLPGAELTPQGETSEALPTAEGALSEEGLTVTPGLPAIGGATTSPTEIPIFAPTRTTQIAGVNSASQTAYPAPSTSPTAGAVAQAQTTPQATRPLATAPAQTDEPLFPDTPVPNPTSQSQPPLPPPTSQPRPTSRPAPAATPRPPRPTAIPAPTAIPVDVLRGTIRWTAAKSPIVLRRDQQLAPGATLIIEPGVEVRLAPGVSFFVEGSLFALGRADNRVRFVGSAPQRWEGLFGRPGSNIVLEHTEVHGGGAGGTVLISEGGNLALHNAHINDNGGHLQVNDSRLEVRDSEIAGNDMPYGSALEANYSAGGFVILSNNRIGGNRMQAGTSPVRIANASALDTVNLDIKGNLLVGQEGPDLILSTNGPLVGGLSCNALIGGTNGLSVRTETPQVPGFALNIRDNATELHTPPIIPEYLKYGIGRGATSEIALDMRNNWWGNPLGPYEPDRHADGRGEAVGDNIDFGPWLTERPACAPHQ
jgi:hypothetical protein